MFFRGELLVSGEYPLLSWTHASLAMKLVSPEMTSWNFRLRISLKVSKQNPYWILVHCALRNTLLAPLFNRKNDIHPWKKTRPFLCDKLPSVLSHLGPMKKSEETLFFPRNMMESLKFQRLCLAEWASKIQGLTTPIFRKFLFKNSICSRNRRGACNQWTRLVASLSLPAL